MLYEHYDEKAKRADWKESFANYAKEGEDEMMLPDSMDSEADELMDEDWLTATSILFWKVIYFRNSCL